MSKKLSHIDQKGDPSMVDISGKEPTQREATAQGTIVVPAEVLSQLRDSDWNTKKGSIIQTAIIAATMSVKNTYNTIPLCHQIPISSCKVNIEGKNHGFIIHCTVKTNSRTGVEMEALHGVSVAALTIYDMCKALTHEMRIQDIHLIKKTGGKKDYVK